MKNIIIGIVLLGLSGLNVYLPNVGNLFDIWRLAFSGVAFAFGWFVLSFGLADLQDR